MNKLFLIVKHEFKQISKTKMFIIMTSLGPILFAAFAIIPGYIAVKAMDTEKDSYISIYCEDLDLISYIEDELKNDDINVLVAKNIDQGKESTLNKKSKGFAVIPSNVNEPGTVKYYSETGTDFQYSEQIMDAVNDYVYKMKLGKLGLSKTDSQWLTEGYELKSFKISENGNVDDSDYMSVMIITMAISILIMMIVLTYGITASRSVISEKTSKTIEILLSSVDSNTIMLGKVFGASIAGFIQFTVWFLIASLFIKLGLPLIDADITVVAISAPQFILIFAMFIATFFIYIFIYVSFGAGAENEQALGQIQIPMQLMLMLPMILNTSLIQNPNSPITVALSYIPFTSAIVMSTRLLINSPGLLMVLLSLAIQLITLVGAIIFSGKIFSISILRKGKTLNMIELFKLFFKK